MPAANEGLYRCPQSFKKKHFPGGDWVLGWGFDTMYFHFFPFSQMRYFQVSMLVHQMVVGFIHTRGFLACLCWEKRSRVSSLRFFLKWLSNVPQRKETLGSQFVSVALPKIEQQKLWKPTLELEDEIYTFWGKLVHFRRRSVCWGSVASSVNKSQQSKRSNKHTTGALSFAPLFTPQNDFRNIES